MLKKHFKRIFAFIFILQVLSFICLFPCFAESSKYRVQPTDVLSITVRGQPDLTTKTRISDEGFLSFPLLGKVNVKDLTVQEIEEKLKRRLEVDYLVNAQVLVFIEQYHPKQVSVMGEVIKPGKFDMPDEKKLTVTGAIVMGGGFTVDADIANTKILRLKDGREEFIKVDMKDVTLNGEKGKDIVLEPDDIIVVPKGFWKISVVGEVAKPGRYDMSKERKLTIMEGLAMAGGFTKDADLSGAKILRSNQGQKEVIQININDIMVRGDKDKNVTLEPEDVIVIPKGFWQISVMGEVVRPGKYDMPKERQLTIIEAIALAGGFTKDAAINATKIIRSKDGKEEVIKVNIKDITQKNEKNKDVLLEPEDIVFVPESFF
ncbi:MAG: SLBB domain-containing protein [Candidatus Omnitrophota bacterium]